MFVRTVRGDLDPRSLGFTHCHDHLFVFEGQQTGLPENLLLNSYDKTKREVSKFIAEGGTFRCFRPYPMKRNFTSLHRRDYTNLTSTNLISGLLTPPLHSLLISSSLRLKKAPMPMITTTPLRDEVL